MFVLVLYHSDEALISIVSFTSPLTPQTWIIVVVEQGTVWHVANIYKGAARFKARFVAFRVCIKEPGHSSAMAPSTSQRYPLACCIPRS